MKKADYELRGFWIHLINVMVLLHHTLSVASGVVGFIADPSPSIVKVIGGEAATYLWSALLIFAGGSALAARFARRILAEMVAVVVLAMARLLWMVMVIVASWMTHDLIGLQAGIALGGGGLFMAAWAIYGAHYVRTGRIAIALEQDRGIILQHVNAALSAVADEMEETSRTKERDR